MKARFAGRRHRVRSRANRPVASCAAAATAAVVEHLEARLQFAFAAQGAELPVSQTPAAQQTDAAVANDVNGNFVVAWTHETPGGGADVYARHYLADGTPRGPEYVVNTFTSNVERNPSVAMDADGDFVVAWQAAGQDGAGYGIYAQRYNAIGQRVGVEFRVNTTTANEERNPAVAMDAEGDFVVTWAMGDSYGRDFGIYAQRYDSAGGRVGGEVRVDGREGSSFLLISTPSIAMDLDGDYVISWQVGDSYFILGFDIYAKRYDASGAELPAPAGTAPGVGNDFRVNDTGADTQTAASVAMDYNGDFVVAWQSQGQDGGGGYGIYAKRFTSAGAASAGPEFRVNDTTAGNQTAPAVAADAHGDFVIAWQSVNQAPDSSSDGIFAKRYAGSGAATTGELSVNTFKSGNQDRPAVAMNRNGDAIVAWQSFGQDAANSWGLFAQRFDETTLTAGPVLTGLLASNNQVRPAGERMSHSVTVLTLQFNINLSTDGPDSANNPANYRLVHDGSDESWRIASAAYGLNPTTGRSEVTLQLNGALPDGQYVVYVRQNVGDGVHNTVGSNLGGADAAGPAFVVRAVGPVGGEFRANTYTDNSQISPSIATDADGDFVIVWRSSLQDGSGDGVYGQRFSAGGAPRGGEFLVNQTTGGNQSDPSVAMDANGDFVVTWTFNPSTGDGGIYARRYNAAGIPLGGEFPVSVSHNTGTLDYLYTPKVAADSAGNFVVTWQDLRDGSGSGISARRYRSDGAALGSEFRVNVTTQDEQRDPQISMSPDGHFVIAWEYGLSTQLRGLYARRYDPSGAAASGEITLTSSPQASEPALAIDDDGNFVAAWQAFGLRSFSFDVVAQRFNAVGVRQGSEIVASAANFPDNRSPAVSVDADGDFVVVWQGNQQDGSEAGVYARRYAVDGTPQGDAFRVNTYTDRDQRVAAVSMDDDGDFVTAWSSDGQDGSSFGVYAQRFAGAAPVLNSVTVNDGSAQRSRVKSLRLTFSQPVSLADGAAVLERLNTGGSGANDGSPPSNASDALATPTSTDGGKTWTFTFDAGSEFVQTTSAGASTGSLIDGIYKLSVDPTKVTAGGITMTSAPQPVTFHRLFGDVNGNGTVNTLDYGMFRNAFARSSGQAGYEPAFDFDGNGAVNTADYGQFKSRYGRAFALP